MKKAILVFTLGCIVFVSKAQEQTPRVDGRQQIQEERIQQGRASGELTHRETALLRKEQRHIHRAERRAKADGDVTRAERRKLDRKQDRSSRHILRANNNPVKPE